MSDREEIDELQLDLRKSWVDLARNLNEQVAELTAEGEEIPRDLVLNLNQVQSHIDRLDKQSRAIESPLDATSAEQPPDDPLGGLQIFGTG